MVLMVASRLRRCDLLLVVSGLVGSCPLESPRSFENWIRQPVVRVRRQTRARNATPPNAKAVTPGPASGTSWVDVDSGPVRYPCTVVTLEAVRIRPGFSVCLSDPRRGADPR